MQVPHQPACCSDLDKLLKAIDLRLNTGAEKLAHVRKLDDGRIEVAMLDRMTRTGNVSSDVARPGTWIPHPGQQIIKTRQLSSASTRTGKSRGAR